MLKKSALIIALSISLVGCSNTSNKVNVMPANKVEEVVKSEYASRMERIIKSTIHNYGEDNEYDKRYLNSKNPDEQFYGADRDRYKDYIENISTFRTDDEGINKLHDKLIEVSLDVDNMLNERVELAIEEENLYAKDKLTEAEDKRIDEIDERENKLEDLIDNQEEHVQNILDELAQTLGL